MKSYLKIALLVICIFIPMELYTNTNTTNTNTNSNSKNINPIHNSQPNTIVQDTIKVTIPDTTKYASVNTQSFEIDKPPFDGLEPKELLTRLNYIYYATSNPKEPIHYLEYKTHSDKLLDSDNTTLSTNDEKLLKYSNAYYPQLSKKQIDTRDCLNEGSEKSSCFQNPSLFFNIKNDFNILSKGVSENNANLLIREDFNNLSNKGSSDPVLFTNAPNGNLDKVLDKESNEYINLNDNNSLCKNCKLAVCNNDYCSLQNQLFM